MWDVVGGELLETYDNSERTLTSLAISQDGSTIVAGNVSGQILVWQFTFGVAELLDTIDVHTSRIDDVVIYPSGQLVVTASSDETLGLVDLSTASIVLTLPFSGQVRALAFDQAGRVLAAAGQPSTVQLWQLPETSP
jgi:WD40 repeat protein